ncbi:1,4-dihydroxy-2-naphthoate polyprenyltransferase [Thiospirochaeta perfilievii]|uniref:1,4-dihydroxy-2-naphthoate polyprenyltransferase n=1 Tax=Thiospirochaeta perfilievii TaxID=252967 RepID=A0A5C1Q6B5_9SPIO|nr:1,4-dihydroxy-2-naphthoate polyprenyltransferase [Thiospirochaeta perfilievii]QEN03515.1 1,4-dihydroxy-2-naphthoate polyprenyltransferase [Thiospirochaeta perfilievii]
MNLKSFFKLVEIQTKVASLFPLLIGTLFTLHRYGRFDILVFLIFFVSLLCIDLATTAINNFMDYKKAIKKDGYNYEIHNAMVRDGISEKAALVTIITLLILGSFLGIILFLITDLVVLFVGILSFAIGVTYSYGPIPISRTPFGELFSGVVMGGLILFLTVYIQVFDTNIISADLSSLMLSLNVNLEEMLSIFFISLPLIFLISNIMLANNICDLDDDVINRRYTLPYYIGKKNSLLIYVLLNILPFIVVIIGVVFKILPVENYLVLIAAIPIYKNIKVFLSVQIKAETFIVAVKNLLVFGVLWAGSFIISFFV